MKVPDVSSMPRRRTTYGRPARSVDDGTMVIVWLAASYEAVAATARPVMPPTRRTVPPAWTEVGSRSRVTTTVTAEAAATPVAKSGGVVSRTQSSGGAGGMTGVAGGVTAADTV